MNNKIKHSIIGVFCFSLLTVIPLNAVNGVNKKEDTKEIIVKKFKALDENSDGNILKDEFNAWCKRKGVKEGYGNRLFALWDKNDDEKVTLEELLAQYGRNMK